MTGGGLDERAQCRRYADDRRAKTDIGEGSVDCSVSVP